MSILIQYARVYGFRGLENVEVELSPVTVLTGMNNTGKTSFLKALQLVMSNRTTVAPEDFYIKGDKTYNKIIIDLKIVPLDDKKQICNEFEEKWEGLFTTDKIKFDELDRQVIPIRTEISFNKKTGNYKTRQIILDQWPEYQETTGEGGNKKTTYWHEKEYDIEKSFRYEELPFFYMDAHRDILEDMRLKTSFLGKMISKIEYSKRDIKEIERQINELNETTVNKSKILSHIRDTLKELNTTLNTDKEGIEITPFTKKIRDLNKGLSIHYADGEDSFSMEYHGMGTRSWSSLLTLKSFILQLDEVADKEKRPFNPILALEEPEAYLHPNAQKKLYGQLKEIPGQIFISTHSPYIAACAELEEIRSFYKSDSIICNKINTKSLDTEEKRKIKRHVINTRGELLFSKAAVLFEGDTEEQALPIFAEKYFGSSSIGLEIDFVGVGGNNNYRPFLRLLEDLKIPWFILSDGESETKKTVAKAIKNIQDRNKVNIDEEENVFVLDNGCDFERYLIQCGYIKEIEKALTSLHSESYLKKYIKENQGPKKKRIKTAKVCEKCKQNIYEEQLRNYEGDDGCHVALYDCMTSQKTKFGPVIAKVIAENSSKGLPPKIKELFEAVEKIFNRRKSGSKDG